MDWQPIETAPKVFGDPLLLATERGVIAGAWGLGRYDYSTKKYEYAWTDGPQCEVRPTHWMPMPAPPNTASADEQVGMERSAEPGA